MSDARLPDPRLGPFEILVLGDFASPDQPATFAVDKDRFAEAMATHGGRLLFEVDNQLGTGADPLVIDMAVHGLADFSPRGLLAKVEALDRVEAFRTALRDFVAGSGTLDAVETAFQPLTDATGALADAMALCRAAPAPSQAAKPGKETGDDPLDRLLGMVDAPDAHTPPTPNASRALAMVERLLADQVARILAQPLLRRREAAWRGLKCLVDRIDFRAGLRLSVLDAPLDDLEHALDARIVAPALAEPATAAPALLVAAFQVDNTAADLNRLQRLGTLAGSLQAPLIVSISGTFLGCDTPQAIAAMPYPGGLLDQTPYDQWRSLRGKDAARWITVGFNRMVLRRGHPAAGRYGLGVAEEFWDAGRPLFGPPAWALAAVVGASVARTGWPTEITGHDDGRIGGLDLNEVAGEHGDWIEIPLEANLPPQLAQDLTGAGIAPLVARPNRDRAFVPAAPLLHRPQVYGDRAATHGARRMAQLGYQLLAATVARHLSDVVGALKPARAPAALAAALRAHLAELVGGTGPGADARVELSEDGTSVAVTVTTGPAVLGGTTVRLGFGL